MKEKTIFEKIIASEIPCSKIYEDENTFAFLDIKPESAGHTLVVPKTAFENIFDLPDEFAEHLMKSAKKIAIAIKKSLKCDGVKIIMNNGVASGQIVFHAHIHIIPKWQDENERVKNTKNVTYQEGEAEEIAQKIRGAL